MPEKEEKINGKTEDLGEDELDELFEQHLKRKREPKHRGYGNYERRRIYKGPSVKRETE